MMKKIETIDKKNIKSIILVVALALIAMVSTSILLLNYKLLFNKDQSNTDNELVTNKEELILPTIGFDLNNPSISCDDLNHIINYTFNTNQIMCETYENDNTITIVTDYFKLNRLPKYLEGEIMIVISYTYENGYNKGFSPDYTLRERRVKEKNWRYDNRIERIKKEFKIDEAKIATGEGYEPRVITDINDIVEKEGMNTYSSMCKHFVNECNRRIKNVKR
jgi:hypothetical protein